MKLGIRVSLATVSRYVPKTKPDASQQQRWITFLRGPAELAKRLRLRSPTRSRASKGSKVVGLPRVGGLHHRYRWREAA